MNAPSSAAPSLDELRREIDRLDAQLLETLGERARVAERIGAVKRAENSPMFRPDRALQVIERVKKNNPGPITGEHLAAIWREIMSACLALETPQRVAVLGPKGTFCEQAAIKYFGSAVELIYGRTFDDVFRAAASGEADFGVVGIENSTEGAVNRSLDLFLDTPLHIIGEVGLAVQHHLLRRENHLENIEAVAAHPQALMQCQNRLAVLLPHAERRAVSSNAEGARLAAENSALAALASERAAALFGLHIAARSVQDEAHNRTRFAVVCLPEVAPMPPATGRDRTSLAVSVPDKPGSVHDMLTPLKKHGVSMTRFESRPAKSGRWEYFFYMDLDGHPAQPQVAAALRELQELCSFYKVLGAYPSDGGK